jgi:ABC-type multidrug transport system fused ATPase/permease subunit
VNGVFLENPQDREVQPLVGIRDHAGAILSVLTRREKRELVGIFLISMVSIGLDVLSLGLVIPVIAFLSGSNSGENFKEAVPFLSDLTDVQFVALVMFALSMVYLAKNAFLLFSTYVQNQFNARVSSRLSHQMMTTYMSQPYEFFLNNNSSILIRNINNASMAITGGVKPFMFLFSDILIGVGIMGVLLVVEPVGGLVSAGIFGAAGWSFQRVTRKRVLRMGRDKQVYEGAVIKDVLQGIGAAKDLRVLGRERLFLEQHEHDRSKYAFVQSRYSTVQAIPRLWLETLAVACLSVLVLLIVSQGREISDALPVIALFAAAAFRVLPSINRIISSIQDLQFSRPIVSTLYGDFRLNVGRIDAGTERIEEFDSLLMEQVSFGYEGTSKDSLNKVSLRVERGEAVGIVGQSGAGKSTLVDVLLGLLHATSGSIRVNDVPLDEVRRKWQNSIGYVPQTIYLADDSVRRNVALGIPDDEIDETRVWLALESAQLAEFIRGLQSGLDTIVGERGSKLSGGQRQRIGIARALYHDPQVLILDEATSSLDLDTERGVMDSVESLHGVKTVIIVSHRLSTVAYCNRIYVVEDGRVVEEGAPRTVQHPELR